MRKYLVILPILLMLINCTKKDCPAGYFGEECEEKLTDLYNGEYCGVLTEDGLSSQSCFEVTETMDVSIFDIDVNIKGQFNGENTSFDILEKDITPAKITGGNGNFSDNTLTFTVNYEIFGVKSFSTFSGTK